MQNPGMFYGHTQVPIVAQDLALYIPHLETAGCEQILGEKTTATRADQPQLRKLPLASHPGNMVIASAVDWAPAPQSS